MSIRRLRYRPFLFALAVAALVPRATIGWAGPAPDPAKVSRNQESLKVELSGDVVLEFALRGKHLLGLREARVGSLPLTSDQTLLRPILADDAWKQDRPWVVHRMVLEDVSAGPDGSVTLTVGLQASQSEAALKAVYLWAGDAKRALGPGITPELKAARDAADASRKVLLEAAGKHPDVVKALGEAQKIQDEIDQREQSGGRVPGFLRVRLRKAREKLPALKASVFPELARSDDRLADAYAQIQRFEELRDQRALELGRIHRDYFGSAMLRLPAEMNTPEAIAKIAASEPADAFDGGTLKWTIEPAKVNVAGWPYRGWRHRYALQLAEGLSTRFIREAGTWELGGEAIGTTVVAMRYRGLGGLDETFGRGKDGGIDRNFTTTEIIPGAAGGGPVISPVVPASSKRTDRGFGIAHRVSPWIGRMIRGAGSQMFEFQHRPEGVFASFPDRLADLRVVTEAFTGDRAISQINEEAFARASRQETTPQYYLALIAPADKPFAVHDGRTRWQEMDQYTRRRVSEELGFVQAEPLPGVGLNLDTAWEPRIRTLTERMDGYAKMGMRMILVHQPGWMNGRGLKECKDPQFSKLAVGGGDCSIYDYVPRPTVAKEWKALTEKLARHKVAYIGWSSYFSVGPGAFIQELKNKHGLGAEDFADFERPGSMDDRDAFFQRINIAHNPNNPTILREYVARIDAARREYGLQGIWADSWHKWALVVGNDTRRPPSFRAWMEQYARWSREGMAFVSEGQGSPIMSCSIELSEQKFKDEWWFLQYTTLWYRGKAEPPGSGTVQADRHTFRVMANKCWPFPETGWGQDPLKMIPDFARLAHEYNAALPRMRRSYVLPDGAGVLWMGSGKDADRGVWFPFAEADIPAGVSAEYILDGAGQKGTVQPYRTYAVTGKDVLKAFGLRVGPEQDPRAGRPYQPIQYTWPGWTGKE